MSLPAHLPAACEQASANPGLAARWQHVVSGEVDPPAPQPMPKYSAGCELSLLTITLSAQVQGLCFQGRAIVILLKSRTIQRVSPGLNVADDASWA